MTKDILKEIIIILLICLAIILLWVAILYRFIPMNKRIPDNVSYVTTNSVKQALKSIDSVDADEVILTYQINQEDLNNYQRINKYKPGKTNPFSSYEQQSSNETGNTISGGGSGGNTISGGGSGNTIDGGSDGNRIVRIPEYNMIDTTEPGTVNPGNYVPDRGTK